MEQVNKYVGLPLNTLLVLLPNDNIVHVEYSHDTPYCMYQPIANKHSILHCHLQPIPDHVVYLHIKDCWLCHTPLCGYTCHPELGAMVTMLSGDHLF